jgi:hypothetical protein
MYNYTPEDLLQYLYNETDSATKAAIDEALKNDWTLREKLSVIKAAQQRLDTLVEAPRTEAVLNILKYAAAPQKVAS